MNISKLSKNFRGHNIDKTYLNIKLLNLISFYSKIHKFKKFNDREQRQICGMVIAPLSWCRGEWVDYTFVANLNSCLQRILFSQLQCCQSLKNESHREANMKTQNSKLVGKFNIFIYKEWPRVRCIIEI